MLVWLGRQVQEVPRPVSWDSPPRISWGARIRDLILVFAAFAAGGAILTGATAYQVYEVGRHDNRRPVDAIVVMGAAQYNGRPSGVLRARLDHAIELYELGYAPYIIATGGNLPGDVYTEAETGRNYAVAHGVPESAIILENTGGSTAESIRNVRAIMDEHGLRTALFVSDRNHMLRVLRLADDAGIVAWGSPTTTSPADNDSTMRFNAFMHELGALGYYAFLQADVTEAPAPPDVQGAPAGP
jgi:uncharacterized SAM-binding protein YcdF (DUF218 family)